MRAKIDNLSIEGAKLLLRLKNRFPKEIKDVFFVEMADNPNIPAYAIQVFETNSFLKPKTNKDAFSAWNTSIYASNGILNSARTSRILLELLSIERGLVDRVQFLIFHNNNIYSLNKIATEHKFVAVKVNKIARITNGGSKITK